MSGEAESVKMAIVEGLRKEEGEATAGRMLYAYYKLKTRFRNVKELIEFVKENLADKVEIREHKPYPYRDDVGKVIYLRLKNPSEGE